MEVEIAKVRRQSNPVPGIRASVTDNHRHSAIFTTAFTSRLEIQECHTREFFLAFCHRIDET